MELITDGAKAFRFFGALVVLQVGVYVLLDRYRDTINQHSSFLLGIGVGVGLVLVVGAVMVGLIMASVR